MPSLTSESQVCAFTEIFQRILTAQSKSGIADKPESAGDTPDAAELSDKKESSSTPASAGLELEPLSAKETKLRAERYIVEDFKQKNTMKVCLAINQ